VHELTDSSPLLLPDGCALRARLAEDGFLFFRGLLPADDVQQVRGGVFAALGAAGWLADSATVEVPVPTAAAVREGGAGYFDAYIGIQRLQAFHELAHHHALTGLMELILDDPLLVHPRKIARTSLPQDDEYTRPHQDFRLIQGSVDTLTCWVPLGDCPVSLGSLRMLRGSHLGGLIDADAGKGPGGLQVEVEDDDPRWCTSDYRAGDAIVFTSLTVHGALRNNEHRLRFSADFRYQSLLEPVLAASLDPHYAPQVPDWSTLTRGWTSPTSIEAPAGAVLTDMVPPLDPTLSAPPSRLLALA
jgi:hypothetical protein